MKFLLKTSFLIFIILFATVEEAKSSAVARNLTSSQNIEFKTAASGRIEYSPINVEDFVFGIAGIAGAFKSWLTNFISKEIVAPIEPLVANAAKQGAKEFAEGMAVMARGGGKQYSDDLVKAAEKLYPNKVGKPNELHHIIPQYLGGPKNGATIPLNPAYHQQITNEFRKLYKYGQGPINNPILRNNILDLVYKKYPLPPY